jgi:flagellar protein FlaJ
VIVIFIAIAPYAIESQIERRLTGKYEKAYAQLLFEIADAMRGGLDPTKAIIELSKTDTSILKKRLKIAADNIRIGRPFHEVMPAMARDIKSELVQRYATIIGETSRIGGDPAIVIHRAAKDLDDFIKINKERRRQLTTQATIVYIAVAVLLIVLYQLIILFPSLGSIDLNLLGTSNLEKIGPSAISRMSIIEVKQRFFDLCLINAVGTGTVIGAFIDGHFKYGLIHSLILTAVSAVFFVFLII